MKYQLDNITFETNKENCGYETIKSCLDYSYSNECSASELFLLAGGLDFSFLAVDKNTLGYNSMKQVVQLLNKYFDLSIQYFDIQSLEKKIFLIKNALKQGNVLTLFIKAEGLVYQQYDQKRYPYHIVNVYGIDTDTRKIFIADQFVLDNKPVRTVIGAFPWKEMLENTLEIIIYPRNKELQLHKNQHNQIIISNLHNLVGTKLDLFNTYFAGLDNILDLNYRINSITSVRWLVMPLLDFIKEYSWSKLDETVRNEMNQLSKKWKTILLKYTKLCFEGKVIKLYDFLSLDLIVEETKMILMNITLELNENQKE